MTAAELDSGRANQKRRTREAILNAAVRLLEEGRSPTLEDVADAALVSRATAYRYFPSQNDLMNEAVLHMAVPSLDDLTGLAFAESNDPEDRIDILETAVHDATFANERQMRLLLRTSLDRWLKGEETGNAVPLRQNRRSGWIDAALEPVRRNLKPETYERLSAALAMVIGLESMIVFRDVLGMTPDEARAVKSWTVRALVRAALAER